LSEQRCGATRSDGAGLPPRFFGKPLAAPEHKPAVSLRVFFARGEGGGSGARWFSVKRYGKCFFLRSLLHLTEFTINCNGRDEECGKERVSGAVTSPS
jgi:hypothetical protein